MKAVKVTNIARRRHIPARTCAGCRKRDEKRELIRIAASRGAAGVAIDWNQRAPGRGGYVHPAARCVERATRRGGLARQLRVFISPDKAANVRRELDAMCAREGEWRSEASTTGVAFFEKGQS